VEVARAEQNIMGELAAKVLHCRMEYGRRPAKFEQCSVGQESLRRNTGKISGCSSSALRWKRRLVASDGATRPMLTELQCERLRSGRREIATSIEAFALTLRCLAPTAVSRVNGEGGVQSENRRSGDYLLTSLHVVRITSVPGGRYRGRRLGLDSRRRFL
jgi:hypothetical protein